MTFWSAHSHSRYSAKDALPTVDAMIDKAVELGYPALGLTDHGVGGGWAQLYTGARKAGIEPLPGVEAYVALDRLKGKRPATMHMGMLATSAVGYRNLVGLVTASHANFRYKPVIDMADLAAAGADGRLEGVAALSGCWFGVLPTLLREGSPIAVRNLLTALDAWFGSGLYVEMQHHNIDDETHTDAAHVGILHGMATALGLPMVITQDSHYCEPEDRRDHETMKRLMSWSDDVDDAVFPGDGYHMVDESWLATRYTPKQLSDGLAGLDDLLSKAQVVIPELDDFKLAVPDTGGDPDELLTDRALETLEAFLESGRIPASKQKAYRARIGEELDVVTGAGFSGYLLLFEQVCAELRTRKILYNVRGSASGSMLCWLLGITSFDPIAWKLPFDRFLSSDRTKPPDIDIDIEHRRRGEIMEWMRQHYFVTQIGTWLQMGLEADENDQKGSLLVRWKMHARKTGQDPNVPVGSAEWRGLQRLSSHKAYLGYGVHAAGLMITPDEATAACVPLHYVASSKTMVTAFGKDDVERMGLVKGDFLGLKTLTALRIMSEQTGIDLGTIGFKDKEVYSRMRQGKLTGLFQLEGGASAKGIRQLQPTKLSDVIAAMALFRPATLESGATEAYIKRRKREAPVIERHQIIMEETAETYGVLLYQEQALDVMKRLGLTVEDVERARKAIKASNANVGDARKVLAELRERLTVQAAQIGMSPGDVAWLNDALDAYAGYGFNKAHATSYGVLAYLTAWFRTHHPVAFWCGMLDAYDDSANKVWYGPPGRRVLVSQVDAYKREAQLDGVTLLGPHVNRSRISWSVPSDMSAVRAGLNSIKGVGQVASKELVAHAPYASLEDLATRVAPRRVTGVKFLGMGVDPRACGGTIAALSHAGALHGLAAVPKIPEEPKPKKKSQLIKDEEIAL